MTALHSLIPAGKDRKRVGRGGSRGGTSGKGHKGQKARSGPSLGRDFEGGQMPLTRRLPKRGFTNARFKVEYEVINLKALEEAFENGATVTKESLVEKGIIKGLKTLVKILADGTLSKKFQVHADAFSKAAEAAITQGGGQIHRIEHRIEEVKE